MAAPFIPDRMTVEKVMRAVNRIKLSAGDPEGAHAQEDGLYANVLQAIANDACDDPAGCARAALTTQAIDFPRWRA